MTPKTLEKYFEAKLAAEGGPYDLKHVLDEEKQRWTILDVRSAEDFQKEHIPGAVNIPLMEIEKRWKEISKKTKVFAYCYNITCHAAPKAALFLAKKGYTVRELVGGIAEWKSMQFPVESATSAPRRHELAGV